MTHWAWKFNPVTIKMLGVRLRNDWPKIQKETGAEFVVVSGTSGLCASIAACSIPTVFVRKPEDKHAGGNVERDMSMILRHKPYVFLDDLIDTGATFERCQRALYVLGTTDCRGSWLYHNLVNWDADTAMYLVKDNNRSRHTGDIYTQFEYRSKRALSPMTRYQRIS